MNARIASSIGRFKPIVSSQSICTLFKQRGCGADEGQDGWSESVALSRSFKAGRFKPAVSHAVLALDPPLAYLRVRAA